MIRLSYSAFAEFLYGSMHMSWPSYVMSAACGGLSGQACRPFRSSLQPQRRCRCASASAASRMPYLSRCRPSSSVWPATPDSSEPQCCAGGAQAPARHDFVIFVLSGNRSTPLQCPLQREMSAIVGKQGLPQPARRWWQLASCWHAWLAQWLVVPCQAA